MKWIINQLKGKETPTENFQSRLIFKGTTIKLITRILKVKALQFVWLRNFRLFMLSSIYQNLM